MTLTQTPAPGMPTILPGAGTKPLVIGLDLSLTSTGIAGHGWTDHIRTKTRGDHRLHYLLGQVATFIRAADLVVMEGPSYGHAALAGHEDMAGLRCMVRQFCYRHRIPYGVISPSSLKLYGTGNGRATKGEIRSAVADRYGLHTEGAARYDEADAYVAMAAGMDWLGYRLADVPARAAAALAKVQWPEQVPAVAQ
ncbi:hypothetical protein Q5762_07295 [Streptomyces sp. P9(2023)]|uniref:hypothetical protein n=1 Tax=Streptomyces sp. P9(2023) TaxID=3064394 RepID=UPI0028F40487|nr:hypothetical protein [Streptomyces sp. P9(2023)]MDT9688161.1 hypothetical protein [Streptomyces sp. P9(2023)]